MYRDVFPTHVGVFLPEEDPVEDGDRLPHARGGVSIEKVEGGSGESSSPRTWGCFCSVRHASMDDTVFPTHVGVFLVGRALSELGIRLPHARGGVSQYRHTLTPEMLSSPRTWGCFSMRKAGRRSALVFPTHVGVFPACWWWKPDSTSLPHARGGVSFAKYIALGEKASSPRTWGCFFLDVFRLFVFAVFPTHVGVFLIRASLLLHGARLPHARGGVSR